MMMLMMMMMLMISNKSLDVLNELVQSVCCLLFCNDYDNGMYAKLNQQ